MCRGPFQDHKLTNHAVADVLPVSLKKIDGVKRRFDEEGLEAALDKRKAERTYTRAYRDFEVHLIALSCGKLPPGHARWSLRLLGDRMVELEYVDGVSHEKVRRVLKKRTEAVEEAKMGHSAQAGRRLRGSDGAGARCVQAAIRSRASRGMYGRIAPVTDPGNIAAAGPRPWGRHTP